MDKIEQLLSEMTIKEKVAQLNLVTVKTEENEFIDISDKIRDGLVGNVLKSNGAKTNYELQKIAVEESRLGIPIMFQEDVIHGYKTIFPMPLGEAASWNLDRIEETAQIAAKEASASGLHLTYAPMVDITRDPRWGRIVEGAGEDPYLSSKIAVARVKGFQGDDLSAPSTMMACAKHFIGYGDALAGRDYNIGDFSEREMREIYLPPFKAAIDQGVGSMMVAYSAVDGIPATANKKLLKDLLRDELGFEGMLITDWNTIDNLIKAGVASDGEEATKQAIEAGVDVDMISDQYITHLEKLIDNGTVVIEALDTAVERVLRAKQELGLFDNPYLYFDEEREKEVLLHKDHLVLSRKAARESMVLLKNENNFLPLSKDLKKIAVIGPMADRKKDLMSWWAGFYSQGDVNDVVSLLDGVKSAVGSNTTISYAPGITLDGFEKKGLELIPEAVEVANNADVVILAIGEEYWMSGEGGSISDIELPGAQLELIEAIKNTGKPVVAVLLNGRPYDFRKPVKYFDAVLEAWFPGTMAGAAIADILFGDYNPSGKLPVTFPQNTGQIPIFYNYKRTSHDGAVDISNRALNNYIDITTDPLFPFGFGLSYTKYKYSKPKAEVENGIITITVDVANIGDRDGYEIVQLYVRDDVTQVVTPHKELKGFERVFIKQGESKSITFSLNENDLTYIGKDLETIFEKGTFTCMVGPNSDDVQSVQVTL